MLVKKVYRTIKKYRMFDVDDKVVIGVSGGQDSVALLHILYQLKSSFNLHLYVGHLNHMFRGKESEEDAEYVKNVAYNLQIPVTIESFNVPDFVQNTGLSNEEGARIIRYRFLKRVAENVGANKIAVGHTASDLIETFFMRLIRGSGIKGLSSIPPIREGKIIRPLVEVFRSETEEYCKNNHLYFRLDSSNEDFTYLRNKIRGELLPLLAKNYNPKIEKNIAQTVQLFREENDYLENQTKTVYQQIIHQHSPNKVVLRIENLIKNHRALQRRILRKAIKEAKGNTNSISFKHIESILNLIRTNKSNFKVDLPHRILVSKTYEYLIISLINEHEKEEGIYFEYSMFAPSKKKIPELDVTIQAKIIEKNPGFKVPKDKPQVAYFDADKLKFPLIIRNRRQGDKFHPLEMKGKKKLKNFFIDLKIPQEERDRIPLILSNKNIIWVVGLRTDEKYKVTEETKKLLEIRAKKEI